MYRRDLEESIRHSRKITRDRLNADTSRRTVLISTSSSDMTERPRELDDFTGVGHFQAISQV